MPGVRTDVFVPDDGNRYPTLRVSWDQKAGATPSTTAFRAFGKAIQSSKFSAPTIRASCPPFTKEFRSRHERAERVDHIELVSMTIQSGEEMIVGKGCEQFSAQPARGSPHEVRVPTLRLAVVLRSRSAGSNKTGTAAAGARRK